MKTKKIVISLAATTFLHTDRGRRARAAQPAPAPRQRIEEREASALRLAGGLTGVLARSVSLVGLPRNVAPTAATRISCIVMQAIDDANRPPPEMPELAANWGCDEETWKAIKNKQGLIKLCAAGEEDHFKSRLAKLKELIASAPPPKPALPPEPALPSAAFPVPPPSPAEPPEPPPAPKPPAPPAPPSPPLPPSVMLSAPVPPLPPPAAPTHQ